MGADLYLSREWRETDGKRRQYDRNGLRTRHRPRAILIDPALQQVSPRHGRRLPQLFKRQLRLALIDGRWPNSTSAPQLESDAIQHNAASSLAQGGRGREPEPELDAYLPAVRLLENFENKTER